MRIDDVSLILKSDVKLWSRMRVLVNTAHTQIQSIVAATKARA